MTIKVTVRNDDTRETAVIGVRQHSADGATGKEYEFELAGGNVCEVWVHSQQNVTVREIKQ